MFIYSCLLIHRCRRIHFWLQMATKDRQFSKSEKVLVALLTSLLLWHRSHLAAPYKECLSLQPASSAAATLIPRITCSVVVWRAPSALALVLVSADDDRWHHCGCWDCCIIKLVKTSIIHSFIRLSFSKRVITQLQLEYLLSGSSGCRELCLFVCLWWLVWFLKALTQYTTATLAHLK